MIDLYDCEPDYPEAIQADEEPERSFTGWVFRVAGVLAVGTVGALVVGWWVR